MTTRPIARLAVLLGVGALVVVFMLHQNASSGTSVQSPASAESAECAIRTVWEGPGGNMTGSISRDAKLLAFVDWETGDLALKDMTTGDTRRLTHKGSWAESQESAFSSVISPDGTRVAYAWRNSQRRYELRVIGTDGSRPEMLYKSDSADVFPADWSPDGAEILTVLLRPDGTRAIALVHAADWTFRVLKGFDSHLTEGHKLSPDGRTIAYDFRSRREAPARDVHLLAVDGTRHVPLVDGPADDTVVGWSPDSSRVLFVRESGPTFDLWAIDVTGESRLPRLVRRDLGGVMPLDVAADGLYYVFGRGMRTVNTATLDPVSGQASSEPVPIQRAAEAASFGPEWSPDGRSLAYFSTRGGYDIGSGSRAVIIRSVETGEEREVPVTLDYPYGHKYLIRWSGDGRSVFTVGNNENGRETVYRVDIRTGRTEAVLSAGNRAALVWFALTSRTIFYAQQGGASEGFRVARRELGSAQEKELYRLGLPQGVTATGASASYSAALSPDGKRLAVSGPGTTVNSHAILVLPSEGGKPRRLGNSLQEFVKIQAWTADGRGLLVTNRPGQVETSELWRIPVDTGEPQRSGLAKQALGLFGFSLHPDGRRVAFSTGQIVRDEVRVIEGCRWTEH